LPPMKTAENTLTIPKGEKYITSAIDGYGKRIKSLPCGRINKQYTGIGATTMELEDMSRNSILVMPTRVLAATKSIGSIMYFGSRYLNSTLCSIEDLKWKIKNPKTGEKAKACMVADTFNRLFWENQEFFHKNFHLLIDEVDMFQTESGYRPALDEAIEIYLTFPEDNRTMISATLEKFSLKELAKEPIRFIECEENKSFKLEVYRSKGHYIADLAYLINRVRIAHPFKKLVVALNSVSMAGMVVCSDTGFKIEDVHILCSENSASNTLPGTYYQNFNGHLERNLTFITSAYFVGIDILDDAIVLAASNYRQAYTIISISKAIQIFGRVRPKKILERYYLGNVDLKNGSTKCIRTYKAELNSIFKKGLDSFIGHPQELTLENSAHKKRTEDAYNKKTLNTYSINDVPILRIGIDFKDFTSMVPKVNHSAKDYLLILQTAKNQIHRKKNGIDKHFKAYPQINVCGCEKDIERKWLVKFREKFKKDCSSLNNNSKIECLKNYFHFHFSHYLYGWVSDLDVSFFTKSLVDRVSSSFYCFIDIPAGLIVDRGNGIVVKNKKDIELLHEYDKIRDLLISFIQCKIKIAEKECLINRNLTMFEAELLYCKVWDNKEVEKLLVEQFEKEKVYNDSDLN
jgi:hypothetical protein